MNFKPNCRYGHGDLLHISNLEGKKVSFGYVMLVEGQVPGSLVGMDFWACKTCGYTELFDSDVEKTIQMMEPPNV